MEVEILYKARKMGSDNVVMVDSESIRSFNEPKQGKKKHNHAEREINSDTTARELRMLSPNFFLQINKTKKRWHIYLCSFSY